MVVLQTSQASERVKQKMTELEAVVAAVVGMVVAAGLAIFFSWLLQKVSTAVV